MDFTYVKTLTSLAIWGPGGGGAAASIIRLDLVHIYPLFNNQILVHIS